ncbi:MAG: ATP-grasp domain-containing protein [Thermoanaerobaculia bacterium]
MVAVAQPSPTDPFDRPDLTVLVLAAGGTVSQGILKALAAGGLRCRVLAACVSPLAAGLHWAERAMLSPLAADPDFAPWLFELCRSERIDAVLAGQENVLDRLAGLAQELRDRTGVVALVAPPASLAIARDKLETCQWLQSEELPYPAFAAADDDVAVEQLVRRFAFPLWAKPRCASGSRGGFRVDDAEALAEVRRKPGYLLQEFLGADDDEYSAGVLSDLEGVPRGVIVLKRRLAFGLTVAAEAGDYPDAEAVARAVAAALAAPGPCNVQMRRHRGRFVPFEINLRFSSTTPVRVALGFPEVEAALRHFVLNEPLPPLPRVTRGVAVRHWEESYPDPDQIERLRAGKTIAGASRPPRRGFSS